MRKKTSKVAVVTDNAQAQVDKIVAQLEQSNVSTLNMDGLISVLAENNTISGNTVKSLQDALVRLGSVQPVVNIEAPSAPQKPTKWSIEINRDSRGDATSYDLVPHFVETVS